MVCHSVLFLRFGFGFRGGVHVQVLLEVAVLLAGTGDVVWGYARL